jgi:hypothetical protein
MWKESNGNCIPKEMHEDSKQGNIGKSSPNLAMALPLTRFSEFAV